MDSAGFTRVRTVFEAALDRPRETRATFVTQTCGADDALRTEVLRLLRLHEAEECDGSAMPPESGELLAALAGAPPLGAGARLGTWRLLRPLGAGGMGDVWEAEQDQPRRRAAIKVMRAGPASARLRARFRDEIDALARLQHPRIARILEAGDELVPGGTRLWYAMELVPGARTLSAWAAGRRLPWRGAVALVRALCEAVEHGHRNGVIHRDLKPGNILIGEDGRPRVIDFGVARITEQGAGLASRTQAGELVGTLGSMAPEQLDGRADVRSDVYGLGMLLHELLAGRPPYDVEGLSLTEATRRVREALPPPPSAAQAGLPPELDWITGKALEKDPELRYASVAQFAEDLRRLRDDEPVSAGAPGRTYGLRKFVKRHRVGVGLAALILLLLVGGSVGTTTGWLRALDKERDALRAQGLAEARELEALNAATREARAHEQEALARAEAEDSAREAQAVTEFLVQVFGIADPDLDGHEARVIDALDLAEARLADFLAEHPRAEVRLRTTLGQLDEGLGRPAEAEVQIRRALELRRAQPEQATANASAIADDISSLRHGLASVLVAQRRFTEAGAELDAVLDELRARHGDADEGLMAPLITLGLLRHREGRLQDSEQAYREALAICLAARGPADRKTASVQANLASLLMDIQRFEDAEPLLVTALATLRRETDAGDPLLITCLSNLAGVRHYQQRWGDAAALQEEVVAMRSRKLPEGHPVLLTIQANLATLRFFEGRPEEALRIMEQVLAVRLRSAPAHDAELVTMLCNLGSFARPQGQDAVRDVVQRLLEAGVGAEGSDPRAAWQLENFARFLDTWSLVPEALALVDEAATARRRLQRPDEFDALMGRALRTRLLAATGQPDEARAVLLDVRRVAERSLPADDPRRGALNLELARGWQRLGAPGEMELLALEAVRVLEPHGTSPDLRIALELLDTICTATGRTDEAAEWQRRLAVLPHDEASP